MGSGIPKGLRLTGEGERGEGRWRKSMGPKKKVEKKISL